MKIIPRLFALSFMVMALLGVFYGIMFFGMKIYEMFIG